MRLRTFIILICAGVIGVIMTFFYFQTDTLLGTRFSDMKSLHFHSVSQFATTILEARKYSLRTFLERSGTDNELGKSFLLAHADKNFSDVKKKLEAIKKDSQTDIVDIIHVLNGRTLQWKDLERRRAILKLAEKGKSGFAIETVRGEPALLSYYPIKVYEEVVGVLVLGYFMNRQIAREISAATNTTSEFVLGSYSGHRHVSEIPIIPSPKKGVPAISVKLLVDSDFINTSRLGIREDVLVVGGLSLLLVIFAVYLLLEFGFVRQFKRTIHDIAISTAELDKGIVREFKTKWHPIREVRNLSDAFRKYTTSLKSFQKKVEEKSTTEAVGKMAAQVAHDLRSPLSALEVCLDPKSLGGIPEDRRNIIRATIERIRGIVHVLSEKTHGAKREGEETSVQMVAPLVCSIVVEKKSQYASRTELTLREDFEDSAYGLFAKLQPTEFKRVLSNLVDNAVQAMTKAGTVTVKLTVTNGFVRLCVNDTGCGIPPEILPKLFERGMSHGKANGSGLGLSHAKLSVENWGGTIRIESKKDIGTTVTIDLPQQSAPKWFAANVPLKEARELVILDDDRFIHDMWDQRVRALGANVQVRHFQRIDELVSWHEKESDDSSRFYLCDYELIGQPMTGLQLIEKLSLQDRAILVTSHHEERPVQAECEKLGVKLIPKPLAKVVTFEQKGRA